MNYQKIIEFFESRNIPKFDGQCAKFIYRGVVYHVYDSCYGEGNQTIGRVQVRKRDQSIEGDNWLEIVDECFPYDRLDISMFIFRTAVKPP